MAEIFDAEGAGEGEGQLERGGAAIAVALDEARGRRKRTDTVDAFLQDQRRLTAAQLDHLHAQFGQLRWRLWGDRLKVTLQALTILVGVIVLGTVGVIAWSAARDHDLVIDGFSVPPDLAQQGSTAGAVAAQLHDKLGQFHEETVSPNQSRTVREKSASDARVEIPETGLSLTEVNRLLHDWLGHETHISGELSHVAAGPEKGALVLNIRVGEQPGVRLTQPDGDLESLMSKAAERVYGDVEPQSYADWLDQHGRTAEAITLARRLTSHGDPAVRAGAMFSVANYSIGTLSRQEERALLAQAVRLGAQYAMNNLAVTDAAMGHTELALREFRDSDDWGKAHPSPEEAPEARQFGLLLGRSNVAATLGDFSTGMPRHCHDFEVEPCDLQRLLDAVLAGPSAFRSDSFAGYRTAEVASMLANLHDTRDAAAILAAPRADLSSRSEGYRREVQSQWVGASAQLHRARGDWPGLLQDAKAADDLAAQSPAYRIPNTAIRWRPVALANLGDAAGARAAAAALPNDCYGCAITRARTEEALGDRAAADRWYAEAVRQAPSIGVAEGYWAETLLARGDAERALAQAQASYRKSPRFAEASAFWGEALLVKGDAKGATAKFEEAAKLAPRWGRLRLKWGEALARQGKAREARAQFASAAALDLTLAERAELAKVSYG